MASLATWTSALGGTRTFSYAYDSADRQTTVTYPTGEVVTNAYDAGWRQTSACSSLGGCYASGATYNALAAPTAWTYGNSLGQNFGYDILGRVNSIQVGGGSVLNLGYTYDNVGNVATNTDTLNSQTQNYAYDHRDRLTHAWTTGSATAAYDESYTYNAIGNITGKGPTGSLATYGYNASGASSVRPHAVTAVGSDVYQYDGNGNLTSRTGKTITWNVDNTVASVVGPDNVPEGYSYDANGQRVTRSRNLGQPGGFTTVYAGGLYEEDTPSGDKRLLYTFAGRVVAQRTIVGGSGTGTVAYLHGDLLGSTGATTSSAGATTATQRYTPFGSVRAGGSLPTAIGFTGQRQDGTGLLYYNARYYDAGIGRFASSDTAPPGRDAPQARNRYSYVKNNPLKYADPTGHCPASATEDNQYERERCYAAIGALADLRVSIDDFGEWASQELELVLAAIRDFYAKSQWTREDFMRNIGADYLRIGKTNKEGVDIYGRGTDGDDSVGQALCLDCGKSNHKIVLSRTVFTNRETLARGIIVHELAHQWSDHYADRPAQGIIEATGSGYDEYGNYAPGEPTSIVSVDTYRNHSEDFAESVAASIYPDYEDAVANQFAGSSRNQYALQAMYCYGPGRGAVTCSGR